MPHSAGLLLCHALADVGRPRTGACLPAPTSRPAARGWVHLSDTLCHLNPFSCGGLHGEQGPIDKCMPHSRCAEQRVNVSYVALWLQAARQGCCVVEPHPRGAAPRPDTAYKPSAFRSLTRRGCAVS
eukprot:352578-Chlamydomonas_euryale.AAC.1